MIFSLQSITFIYYNYNEEILTSSIPNLFDPKLKIGFWEKLSDGSNTIEDDELLTPEFNKITINRLKSLVYDTYVKFSGSNKLNKLNFKDEIIYKTKLNTFNNLLIKNITEVEFYTQTINYLEKTNGFYNYVLYLTKRNISSNEVPYENGIPFMSIPVCEDIFNFRTLLKNLYDNNELSIQNNYHWNMDARPWFDDYCWVPDTKTDQIRNNLLMVICYNRLQDSILFMAKINLNKAFYLVGSTELVSYRSYFSSVFERNNNRIYSSENSPCFFNSSLTSI